MTFSCENKLRWVNNTSPKQNSLLNSIRSVVTNITAIGEDLKGAGKKPVKSGEKTLRKW